MTLYTDLAVTVSELLAEFGADMEVYAPGSPTAATAKGVRSHSVKYTLGNSGVAVGDEVYFLETGVEPKEGGRFSDGVTSYVIIYVEPIKATTTVMAWEVTVRRG